MEKRHKRVLLIVIVAVLVVSVGITVAYFVAPITRTNQTTSVTTGTLRLTFNDVSSSISKTMNFGESVTREFTIENTGSIDAYAKLSFKNLVNSYMLGSLKYTLTYSETGNAGTYKTKLTGMNVPVSASSTNYEITDSLLIPANTTYHYQITVTLIDSDVIDQTADLNASFYTEFTIENGTELNSASEKTLAALNLTKSSGIPDFSKISPASNGANANKSQCMYNGNIAINYFNVYGISENELENFGITEKYENMCQEVFEITNSETSGYFDSSIKYLLEMSSGKSLSYLGKAIWDNETETCKYETETLYVIREITSQLQVEPAFKSACNDAWILSDGTDSTYVTGIKKVGPGQYIELTQESGIYSMEDDYGTSYYFRGDVTNNYVKFAKTESNADIYWRIVRINGDGSLRIIFDGTSAHSNDDTSNDRGFGGNIFAWNGNNSDDAKYVGYMYGGANGVASTSKLQAQQNDTASGMKVLADWLYESIFKGTIYSEMISDEVFCNDREVEGDVGYGQIFTMYSPAWRQSAQFNPTLKCNQKNDSFTVNNIHGNGALTYPIGLLTVDEANIAGLKEEANTNNYLYKNTTYWLMSPKSSENDANVYTISNGIIDDSIVNTGHSLVPVINLSADAARTLVATTVDGKTIYSLP